jgi:hypothetical protein
MAETKYTKQTSDFTGLTYPAPALCALQKEIASSTITKALDRIAHVIGSTDYDIWFKDELSIDEGTILGAIIASHTGEPLPTEPAYDSEEALVTRIKKASYAKNYQKRGITFISSKLGSEKDEKHDRSSYSNISLRFYKLDGSLTEITGDDLNQTFLDANCVRTSLEIDLDYEAELDEAFLYIPATLAGDDDDAWKYAMVLAPTTAFAVGLSGLLKLKWHKGGFIELGGEFEVMKVVPDYLGDISLQDGHIIHLIIDHPIGAQTELYGELIHYK